MLASAVWAPNCWPACERPEAARARLALRTLLPGASLSTNPPSPASTIKDNLPGMQF